jgi:hypothetical protein
MRQTFSHPGSSKTSEAHVKSVVIFNTSNALECLFKRIKTEPEESCLYKLLFLDYTYGLNRIYTKNEINAAKPSPSFESQYNLKYLGLIGNNFHIEDINAAIEKGQNFSHVEVNSYF